MVAAALTAIWCQSPLVLNFRMVGKALDNEEASIHVSRASNHEFLRPITRVRRQRRIKRGQQIKRVSGSDADRCWWWRSINAEQSQV